MELPLSCELLKIVGKLFKCSNVSIQCLNLSNAKFSNRDLNLTAGVNDETMNECLIELLL